MVFLHFDGACEPFNPGGHGAWGVWIEGLSDGPYGLCGYIGYGEGVTNNVAEYTGLIHGLRWLVENNITRCEVCGDSQLVISQMTGEYAVRSPLLLPLWREASDLASRIPKVGFSWVPRHKNRNADLWSRYGFYCIAFSRAVDVLDKYRIENDGHIWFFRNPKKMDVWQVQKGKDELYKCSCPAFLKSRIGVCKHVTAAWMLDHGQGGPIALNAPKKELCHEQGFSLGPSWA